ncbi:MAG: gliding motility protein GldB, partial [Bacteroidales bacterium]|nr:gliding motility protein GldB [Bacteroidales bacterium]
MRRIYILLLAVMLVCIGCEWRLTSSDDKQEVRVAVERYDRIQSQYLTTGDFSALQQMNTAYPQQTRTLIEDVLKIGHVNDSEINLKFLAFYQDSTLQTLLAEAEQ